MSTQPFLFLQVLAVSFSLAASLASAHGKPPAAAKPLDPATVEDTPFGRAGDPKRVTRTIKVDMRDTMRFSPSALRVKRGDTVRFVVTNRGKVLHELVIGAPEDLKKHAELMRKFPGMEHDAPHMTHVKPGKSGQIVWQFTQAGEYGFACLIPGHFEAGMAGTMIVD
jgi:uncharacterized cupredoxin-like copper-binding protein